MAVLVVGGEIIVPLLKNESDYLLGTCFFWGEGIPMQRKVFKQQTKSVRKINSSQKDRMVLQIVVRRLNYYFLLTMT